MSGGTRSKENPGCKQSGSEGGVTALAKCAFELRVVSCLEFAVDANAVEPRLGQLVQKRFELRVRQLVDAFAQNLPRLVTTDVEGCVCAHGRSYFDGLKSRIAFPDWSAV
jgi:hypothetical protein